MLEFKNKRTKILSYCWDNGLRHEVCNQYGEVDFLTHFGMEATDRDTLENPTCIECDSYVMVYLPEVKEETRCVDYGQYFTKTSGLMEIAKPEYLLGVENGIAKAVMYCVF